MFLGKRNDLKMKEGKVFGLELMSRGGILYSTKRAAELICCYHLNEVSYLEDRTTKKVSLKNKNTST